MSFLPVTLEDMAQRGWDQLDFIFISGDAYVDHPSFGSALICRLLESRGFRVGLICQPDWKDYSSFTRLGKPRLGFLVSGGNMDTLVQHYTSSGRRRKEDYFSPGKKTGLRPDRATIVYCAALRQVFKKVPIIIGGIETSLRRMSHYDYWDNKIRRSILLDSKADLAVYGMGERPILEIAEGLNAGIPIEKLKTVRGTVVKTLTPEELPAGLVLPPFSEQQADKKKYAESFMTQYKNTDPFSGQPLMESYGAEWIYQNPPAKPLDQPFFDSLYEFPYQRTYHPMYKDAGGIAALQEVQFSLISTRGCFGACAFCALTFHQGRIIQSRSHESLIREAKILTSHPDFKGYIHDVGGPTANFRKNPCAKMEKAGACMDRRCLAPEVCKNLKSDHQDLLQLLRKLRELPKVKKVFIRSGLRFDYLMQDPDKTFFKELVQHHISGQLKVAPEHISRKVLDKMGKPSGEVYEAFKKEYENLNRVCRKEQYLVPYFISGHPGSSLKEAIELAQYIKKNKTLPEQVQDFYPTPGTLATAMYYSGYDLPSFKPLFTAQSAEDKAMQRALLQFSLPQNHELVRKALRMMGREDLIGRGLHCLVPEFTPRSALKNSISPRKPGKKS